MTNAAPILTKNPIYRFRNLGNAESRVHHGVKPQWIMLGDDETFWVPPRPTHPGSNARGMSTLLAQSTNPPALAFSSLHASHANDDPDDLLEKIESGGAYVNVHTVVDPMGEVRGQIRSSSSPLMRNGVLPAEGRHCGISVSL